MDIVDLNIPSKFAHSIFLDMNGKEIKVKKGYIDIFYTLVYLGRRKLFELNNNCLSNDIIELKNGKKKRGKKLNDDIDYSETLSFEFYEIGSLMFEVKQQSKDENEGKHNSRYGEIRLFINEFKNIHVKTNIFNKDKGEESKIIKVFDKLEVNSQDKLCFDVVFTEEYISPYMVTKKYFKKVRLDILYKLNSIYSKKMYIFLKDYAGFDKKTNKNDISMFLGMAYNKNKIKSYLLEINNNSDIIVGLEKPKHGKKSDIKFTIENQDYFANEAERYDHDLNKWVHERMMEDCRIIADTNIYHGKVVDSYGAYVNKIYKDKKDRENENYHAQYDLKENISYYKKQLIKDLDSEREHPMMYFESKIKNGFPMMLVIDNSYKLFDIANQKNPAITSNAQETLAYLNNLGNSGNLFKKIKYDFIKNEDWSMMYF